MRLICACCLGFVLLGCGSPQHDSPSGTAGSAGSALGTAGGSSGANAAGGSSSTAGSNPGGAGGAGQGGAGPTTTGYGTVQFGRLLNTQTSSFQASARFYKNDPSNGYACTSEDFGGCRVSTCTKTADGLVTPALSAGTITLNDGQKVNVTLAPSAGQPYSTPVPAIVELSGGEVVTVTATGGDVPAFTGTVTEPLVITVSSPLLAADGSATVPRSADLVLGFDNRAADGETGTELFVQASAPIGAPSMVCSLPTSSGTATIPGAALAKLSSGTDLVLVTTRSKTQIVGDFAVTIIGFISATTPDKSKAARLRLE